MATVGTIFVNVVGRTGQYQRSMMKSAAITRTFSAQMAGINPVAGAMFSGLTGGAVGAAAAVTVSFVAMARSAETFNRSLTQSLAIMGDVSEGVRQQMKQTSFDVARTSVFGSEQVAGGFYFLASAGLKAEQQLAAMPAVARFAQAGMFDLSLATSLLTDAQSSLGLKAADAQKNLSNLIRVSDVLVKTTTLADATTQEFAEALAGSGSMMRGMGVSLEEGAAVLAAFAEQGSKGADGATQFNIVLRDLTTKAIQNREAFQNLGITVFDQQEKFAGFATIIGQMEDKLSAMTPELRKATLLQLGFADKSVVATLKLMGYSKEIEHWQQTLQAAGGTTETVAKNQMTPLMEATAMVGAEFDRLSENIFGSNSSLAEAVELFGRFLGLVNDLLEVLPTFSTELAGVKVNFLAFTNGIAGTIELLSVLNQWFGEEEKSVTRVAEKVEELGKAQETAMKAAQTMADQMEREDAAKKLADEMERLNRLADSVFQSTRTPLEQFTAQMEDLSRLLDLQLISWDTYSRKVTQARDELTGLVRQSERASRTASQGTAAVARGTSAAFSAVQQANRNSAKQSQLEQQQLAEQRQMKELLKEVRDNTKASQGGGVIVHEVRL